MARALGNPKLYSKNSDLHDSGPPRGPGGPQKIRFFARRHGGLTQLMADAHMKPWGAHEGLGDGLGIPMRPWGLGGGRIWPSQLGS